MKFLVWQTAYLGDVVLATPLILTLQKNFPKAHIGFVGRSFIKELLKGYKVELIAFDKGLWESFSLVERLRSYHVAINPNISMRSALILFFSGIPTRIGFDRSELRWLYTHQIKHRWGLHEVDRNLELLRPLGIKELIREPKLYLEEEEKEKVRHKFRLPEEFVVFSPFSNFALKEWSLQRWIELARLIDLPIVLVGTSKDYERSREIKGNKVVNLVGKTSIRELMAVISLSRLVISCDSSPVHIANALGVPAISVYTSTSPLYGFYPLIGTYLTPSLECSPCSPNPKVCKEGHYMCLRGVTAEEVAEKVESFLSR